MEGLKMGGDSEFSGRVSCHSKEGQRGRGWDKRWSRETWSLKKGKGP